MLKINRKCKILEGIKPRKHVINFLIFVNLYVNMKIKLLTTEKYFRDYEVIFKELTRRGRKFFEITVK